MTPDFAPLLGASLLLATVPLLWQAIRPNLPLTPRRAPVPVPIKIDRRR